MSPIPDTATALASLTIFWLVPEIRASRICRKPILASHRRWTDAGNQQQPGKDRRTGSSGGHRTLDPSVQKAVLTLPSKPCFTR